MITQKLYLILIVALILSACGGVATPTPAPTSVPTTAPTIAPTIEKPAAPAATPTSTAPAADSGPVAIVGEATSANFAISPDLYPNQTIELIDLSNTLTGHPEVFVSDQAQILGTFNTSLFSVPAKFQINLPAEPTGVRVDLDNNGAQDKGVQVFGLAAGSNLTGDSYMQQIEQVESPHSWLTDPVSGELTEGSFLVYAPDDGQRFPTASGADKQWFTSDDPAGPIPAGYSVARLGSDGAVTLDRSRQATINIMERAEQAR